MPEDLLARITVEPDKMHGRACIPGMRIRVMDILDSLAHGATREAILRDYPELEDEDITASLLYASRTLNQPVIEMGAAFGGPKIQGAAGHTVGAAASRATAPGA